MEIIVVGYQRSGNVWLARLLGDALDCHVTGYGSALTFAEEGADRPGPYVVRQLLLKAGQATEFGPETKFVHIQRNPRDIAVSIARFWKISIAEAIRAMGEGLWPTGICGTWKEFVRAWEQKPAVQVRYEELPHALGRVLDELGLEAANPLDEAIKRQSFANKKKQIKKECGHLSFGKERQLQHMYRGLVGSWKWEFSVSDAELADEYFGPIKGEWHLGCHQPV